MTLKSPEQRPVVTRVRLDGVRSFRAPKITALLAQRATHPLHWFPLLQSAYPASYLEGMTWQEDRERIRNFYIEHGFFDVRLVGSQLSRSKRTRPDGSPLFVKITHSVREGPGSEVRNVDVVLHDGQGTVLEQEALRKELGKGLRVRTGRRFSLEKLRGSEETITHRLRSRSFARARVAGVADAYPEEQSVDLRFDVYPGRPAVFGEFTIDGLDRVKEKFITRHIKTRPGDPFDQRLLDETQQAIYSMGLFSMVTLNPQLSEEQADQHGEHAEEAEQVPVQIRLRERKPRQFRLTGGMGWEVGRIDGQIGAQLTHINLFNLLVQAELGLSGGYAFLTEDDHGPIGSLKLALKWPDFPVRTLTLHGAAEIHTDVQQGYKLWSPKADVGLAWTPLTPLRINVAYRLSYNDLFPDERLSDLAEVNPELALSDGYILSYFEQSVVLDLRDQPLASSKGFFARVDLVETAAPKDSDFHYIKVSGDLRGYLPLGTPRIVMAARVGGAWLQHTREDKDSIPVNHRVYAGGDGSVRGWRSRYLGPTVVEVIESSEDAEYESTCGRSDCLVPVGGRIGMHGSLEIRGNPVGGLWLAGFSDFGRVWESSAEFKEVGLAPPDGLQFSVGGGVRYDTPIGRLRLDLAFHPPEWTSQAFLEQRWVHRDKLQQPTIWNLHFGIGESF
jgi:outer membrane protein assembly factor BamA